MTLWKLQSTQAMCLVLLAASGLTVLADEWRPIPRRLPPVGKEITAEEREIIEQQLQDLQAEIDAFSVDNQRRELVELLPDVECYTKAVRFALAHDEFYKKGDVGKALSAVQAAKERLDTLRSGHAPPWATATGLVVRGYRSEVDGSVQPYGLVIPEELDLSKPVPLYVWLHGRGEMTTDLHFIHERQTKPGEVQPTRAIVLHPFGRQCLGWKSTAETDVLEAVASVSRRYRIDPDRIALLGFSMGGAGAWQIGAHYTDRFAALHAGAGFVDVARYTRLAPEKYPPVYEQLLWGVSDVPAYARNLMNVPLVAYSGELDKQKDAADFMGEVLKTHGYDLTHLVGPGMGHKYHPDVLADILSRIEQAVRKGRNAKPTKLTFQTRTLRYNRLHWLEVIALEQHWQDSRVDAEYTADDELTIATKNVAALKFDFPKVTRKVRIDGDELAVLEPSATFEKRNGHWIESTSGPSIPLRKAHGLQGPIDDALLSPFLVVVPSGKSKHPDVQRWVEFELAHFEDRWRSVYRGELRIKQDTEVTADDVQQYHVILWGDANSNQVVGKLHTMLPLSWSETTLELAGGAYDASHHVPLVIYPNPLAPSKYIVLNSGPTHREAHDRSNALQNPVLPDWAVVDVRTPPSAEKPGRIVAADFFDEGWQIKSP